MTLAEIQKLDGRTILVQPARSSHNPPIGVRGTVQVSPRDGTFPSMVEITLNYPDMFNRPAGKQVLRVSAAEAQDLIQTKPDGDCRFLYNGSLD